MRNKKSVLKTLSVSYDYSNEAVTGIAGNGSQISEVMAKKIEIALKILIAVGVGVLIWEWFQIISLI